MVKFSIPLLIFVKKYDIILKKAYFSRHMLIFLVKVPSFLLFHCYQRANNIKPGARSATTSPRVIKNWQFDL